ncbi:hypothetical protein CC80DRAFT_88771 [Byssothecium circinans]|uniref:Uncharacterized protein n=1 Tax=Byssothecium circinans TaxID=147558 RepID=A0A6A5TSB7_9PLEO|nr:hypothetical protein CC80DRAFT_88771 [Byssothecium circinans]
MRAARDPSCTIFFVPFAPRNFLHRDPSIFLKLWACNMHYLISGRCCMVLCSMYKYRQ